MLNRFKRYQQNYNLSDHCPPIPGKCSCGCGVELTGRKKRWASAKCASKAYWSFAIVKGNGSAIRMAVFNRDGGYCRACGVYDEKWQADHIIPVAHGGGACDLSNFQTLCLSCHKEKTAKGYPEIGHPRRSFERQP